MSDKHDGFADFTFGVPAENRNSVARKINESNLPGKVTVSDYAPSHPLIESVKIIKDGRSNRAGAFNENFYNDAVRYYSRDGYYCECVEYDAYFPKYSSMSAKQLAFYFWFRKNLRIGNAIETRESYILLYIYELINLSEKTDPEETLVMLSAVFNLYGKKYRDIAVKCASMIRDFSLIHSLPAPSSVVPYIDVLHFVARPEFFFSGENSEAVSLLYLTSEYLFANESALKKYGESYIRHFTSAFIYAYDTLKDTFPGAPFTVVTSRYESYRDIICASSVKRLIEIKYKSPVFSDKMRKSVTETARYIENKLRIAYSLPGRLRCSPDPDVARAIDCYFDIHLPARKKAKKEEATKTINDELYEPTHRDFSPARAEALERESWEATKILTRDDGESETGKEKNTGNDNQDDFLLDALAALLRKDEGAFREIFEKRGILPETGADLINSLAFEKINDSIIEFKDEKYDIIEEYISEAETIAKGEI